MRGRPARIVVWALAHRRAVLAAWGVLLLAALPGLPRLEQENSAEVFFLAGTPEEARYREFTATFGGDEVTRLVLSGPGLWTGTGLAWLGALEERAAALPGVDGVSGLTGRFGGAGWPPDDPEALRAAARADSLARALGWIDAHGEVATLLVSTHPRPRRESALLDAALGALLAEPPPGVSATALGPRTLDAAFDAYGAEIARRFLPLLALLSLLLLALSFRDGAGAFLPFSLVAAALLPLLGAMGYLGVRFNLVLAILPPLLFVIALASAVHLLVRCREREAAGEEGAAATLATYAEKGRALAWTAASTALGFAALAGSPVGPVRSLGLWAAAGCGLLAAGAFTLFPVLLAATHTRRALPERRVERWAARLGRRLAEWAAARRGAVLALFALAALAAAAGLPRLKSESNALAYLPAEHPVRREIADLERRGIGLSTVEMVVAAESDLGEPEPLARLAALAAELAAEPLALSALSPAELFTAAAETSPLAGFLPAEAVVSELRTLLREEPAAAGPLSGWLAPNGRRARLTLFVPTVGHAELAPLRAAAEAAARRAFPEATVELTGRFPLLLDMHRHLLATLGGSLAVAVPALFAVFWLLLGSPGLALRALLPNLWPVLLVFGGMGWAGVPLDLATVMVASVTLGLVVDDTLHSLARHREEARALGGRAAIVRRLERSAPAYLLTGLILCLGFGVCALSEFAPTARFGLLSAAAVALAVVADLLLLPALFGGE